MWVSTKWQTGSLESIQVGVAKKHFAALLKHEAKQ